MKLFKFFSILSAFALVTSCIQDDFVDDLVDPELRITNPIDTLALNADHLLEAQYLNNVGQEEIVTKQWMSSDPDIISVNQNGLITALNPGQATISAQYQEGEVDVADEVTVVVGNSTVSAMESIVGSIRTTSSYLLEGSFELSSTDAGVKLSIMDDYRASSSLPGLYIYLSNNRNTVSNALEIGKVTVFNGAHEYDLPGIGLNDYSYIVYFCKPFNVKVGDAQL